MAIKQPFMIKGNYPTASASLSITAKPGESIRVKALKFGALASGGYLECFIDRVSVGFFYIGNINANHLEQYELTTLMGNVFDSMLKKGIHAGFPVGEGQTFEVKPRVAGDTVIGQIIYEIGEKDDFKPTDPNGSAAKIFTFLNYGTNGSIIATGNYGTLDTPRNPSEYPAFPFGAVVPARQKVEIIGLLFQTWLSNIPNGLHSYGFLKLLKDRVTLWDEDRKGLMIGEGMGMLTWGPCRQTNTDITLLPEPLTFSPGDELLVQISANETDVPAQGVNFACIERLTMLE